jgi:4-coumarate--CoA ligase
MVIDGETTQALPLGEEGELCIRGPQVMQGYLNRPDATSVSVLAEGFLRTGDLARLDDEGTVWIGDRVKELIKVKGFQVAPAELEGLLLEIPEVADACVVGVADERAGEVPKAFVVRATGSSIDVEALQGYLHPKLADFKHPQFYEFVDTIPKSASGKILRRLLRKQ